MHTEKFSKDRATYTQSIKQIATNIAGDLGTLGLDADSLTHAQVLCRDICDPSRIDQIEKSADALDSLLNHSNDRGQQYAKLLSAALRPEMLDNSVSTATPHDSVIVDTPIKDIMVDALYSHLFPIDPAKLQVITDHIVRFGYDLAAPVVCRKEDKTLVDGHTRYKAAQQAGLKTIPVVFRNFANEDAALDYAIHAQRDRRNLTDADIIRLVGELDKRRPRGGDHRGARSIPANAGIDQTKSSAEETAKRIGTSTAKVERARSVLASGNEDLKEQVLSGELSAHKAAQKARARKKPPVPSESTAKRKVYKQAAHSLHAISTKLRPCDSKLADKVEQLAVILDGKAENSGKTPEQHKPTDGTKKVAADKSEAQAQTGETEIHDEC